MRIALISDVHGNLVSLEAVLAVLEREETDQIVCLGDVAATGPQPREVIERLQALGCPVVMGNTDAWLLDPQPEEPADEDTRRILEIDRWCAGQLAASDRDYVRTFQPTLELFLGDGASLLCFHGSPRSNIDVIESTTSEGDLARMLAGFGAAVMAGRHTHVQMLRRYRDAVIVNPGSAGLPFKRSRFTGDVRNPPWAEYALVGVEAGSLNIDFRHAPVDVDAVVQAALDSGMPHAEWWAGDWGHSSRL